jgi:hypothetical protein
MIPVSDMDPIEVQDMIARMNLWTSIHDAYMKYTQEYIERHRLDTPLGRSENLRSPHDPSPTYDNMSQTPSQPPETPFDDRYKMKDFMEEHYKSQRRILFSDIQKLYKQHKCIRISQEELKDILPRIGYKVSNCSHKLTAILDDGFR